MAFRSDDERAMYVISIAAELAGVHPQTLRVYERKGLLRPQRTQGNSRRYSERDIELLKKIQELTQEGINLAGVERIIDLERRVEELERSRQEALAQVDALEREMSEAINGRNRMALVPLKDVRRVRRAMKSDFVERAGMRRTFPAPPVQQAQPGTRG